MNEYGPPTKKRIAAVVAGRWGVGVELVVVPYDTGQRGRRSGSGYASKQTNNWHSN